MITVRTQKIFTFISFKIINQNEYYNDNELYYRSTSTIPGLWETEAGDHKFESCLDI